MSVFQKATKNKLKLRLMVAGASGSGKTTAALRIATAIVKRVGGRIALIDSERGSASLYSDEFDFDCLNMTPPYSPENYIAAINAAEAVGYNILVIDTISPEWKGKGGCLDIHSKIVGNSFTAWAKVTPRHEAFIQALLQSSAHIITTCRSKVSHNMDETTNKVTKQGLEPEQRSGMDYEMTAVFDLNQYHISTATKDRTKLFDGLDFEITENTGEKLMDWLEAGAIKDPIEEKIKALFQKIEYGAAQQIAARTKYPDSTVLLEKLEGKIGLEKEAEIINELDDSGSLEQDVS